MPKYPKNIHQLVHHLQHWDIEKRLLDCPGLLPPAHSDRGPWRLTQAGWPHPCPASVPVGLRTTRAMHLEGGGGGGGGGGSDTVI